MSVMIDLFGDLWICQSGSFVKIQGDPVMHLINDTSSTYRFSRHVFLKYGCAFGVNACVCVCACEYALYA